MSLSFPLHIGTVPKAGTSSLNPDLSYPSFDLVEDGNSSEDELHKLPSYQEAMHEGAPPSPFLEDHI
jgi:hypothetical protein